jgi:hypothetical protein
MPEHISTIIMDAFRKTKAFEKITRIELMLGIFLVVPLVHVYLVDDKRKTDEQHFESMERKLHDIDKKMVLLLEKVERIGDMPSLPSFSSSPSPSLSSHSSLFSVRELTRNELSEPKKQAADCEDYDMVSNR